MRIIVVFLAVYVAILQTAHADLSNTLPTPVVKHLMKEGLWYPAFESNTSEATEISSFWTSITRGTIDRNSDALLGGTPDSPIRASLYPVKIEILRYAADIMNFSAAIRFREGWLKQHVLMALELMKLTSSQEFKQMVNRFEVLVENDQIRVIDLTPTYRTTRVSFLNPAHTDNAILNKDTNSGMYAITGFYNHGNKLLAVDLSRSVNETLVTIAHELVHAVDPKVESARKALPQLESEVNVILQKWLGKEQKMSAALAKRLIDHILFEGNVSDFANILMSVRDSRLEEISEELKNDQVKATNEEKNTIRRYFQSVIDLTIGNEYRAYGFSLLVYSELKSRHWLLSPSTERQKWIDRFLSGDRVFAANLALSANPFAPHKISEFETYLEDVSKGRKRQKEEEKLQALRLETSLYWLEYLYLETTKSFLLSLNNMFFDKIKAFEENDRTRRTILPSYAKPGGWESPANPFQILTARFTTSWVLRFRLTVSDIYSKLQSFNEPFVSTYIGLLDMHDISRGEMELIGLLYSNVATPHSLLERELRTPIQSLPKELKETFPSQTVSFDPKKPDTRALEQEDVQSRLLKLRLYKATQWFSEAAPLMSATLESVTRFLERIRSNDYDRNEISTERAQELEAELLGALNIAQLTRNEVEQFIVLTEIIGQTIQWAKYYDNVGTSDNLQLQINNWLKLLEGYRIYNQKTKADYLTRLNQLKSSFSEQIQPLQLWCSKSSSQLSTPRVLFSGGLKQYVVGDYSFRITSLCYKGLLYLVRQPGDFNEGMLALPEDNTVVARPLDVGVKVRLQPFTATKVKRKR